MTSLAGLSRRWLVAHPPDLEELSLRQYGEEVTASAPPVTGVGHLSDSVVRGPAASPLWVSASAGSSPASALAVPPLYDTPEKIAGYARSVIPSPWVT